CRTPIPGQCNTVRPQFQQTVQPSQESLAQEQFSGRPCSVPISGQSSTGSTETVNNIHP
ncbi:hypothetical protein BaRGS_00034222, partial [Batillaria attramentaria]